MPAATSDTIDLWLTPTDALDADDFNNTLLQRYQALLTPEELQRGKRLHFEKDQHRFWITRALVRTVLSRYAPIAAEDWVFHTNAYGKPGIANTHPLAQSIAFNVSHTTGLVVLAVTAHAALGVDVEHLQRRAPLDAAQAYFSTAEAAELAQLPPSQQSERFFQYWTLKESYIKARGMGLSIPLDQFGFDLSAPGHIGLSIDPRQNDASHHWHLWQLRPTADHLLAVCAQKMEGNKPQLVVRTIVPLQDEHPAFHSRVCSTTRN